MKRPLIIAHRGANRFATENTIPAFLKAREIGCDGVEFDVRLTKDNRVVVFHDEDLRRLFRIDEYTKDISYENLRKITDDKIPLLSDVLRVVKDMKLINIELKIDGRFSGILEEMVLKTVDSFDIYDRVLFSSFNPLSIGIIKKLRKRARIGFLFDKDAFYRELGAIIASFMGCESVNPQFKILNDFMMRHYREWGLKVFTWTADRKDDIREMMRLGVDGIITNRPESALKIRPQKIKDKSPELNPDFWEDENLCSSQTEER
ncbi:MAG: glycerophosphodiester phosphodiesterase family protein [Deltaproteobacteria bacterium]|nr:glycerophosphodiester phosphodiesterase family protein [Deltaproteobacteria bacterium]